jgi:hypothetical protein
VSQARTLRPYWWLEATTVSINSTNLLPRTESVPELVSIAYRMTQLLLGRVIGRLHPLNRRERVQRTRHDQSRPTDVGRLGATALAPEPQPRVAPGLPVAVLFGDIGRVPNRGTARLSPIETEGFTACWCDSGLQRCRVDRLLHLSNRPVEHYHVEEPELLATE